MDCDQCLTLIMILIAVKLQIIKITIYKKIVNT